ncbi:MAG: metal ABC transporter substrate-binding protein [Candidatus Promineifilaceae bacterium]
MKLLIKISALVTIFSILLLGCRSAENTTTTEEPPLEPLSLPQLSAVSLDNRPLKVVATTSIIGDIVGRVGGDAIDLTILIGPGQDSHSYEPSTGDLTAAADADVIFINGWNLEESLITNLENVIGDAPLVPVAAGITPLPFSGHDEHGANAEYEEHSSADPHTWTDPHLVVQWVDNISQTLAALDPANAELYQQNTADYQTELQSLIQYYDEQVATLPAEKRVMVTNHDSFGYFAHAYNFEIIGTVLAGVSTLSEPSADDLANLVDTMEQAGICTIFAETSANQTLAETIAAELDSCENVQVISLYTESIGAPASGDDSYTAMMRANIDAIVNGLQ